MTVKVTQAELVKTESQNLLLNKMYAHSKGEVYLAVLEPRLDANSFSANTSVVSFAKLEAPLEEQDVSVSKDGL